MPSQPRIGPLAHAALADLAIILRSPHPARAIDDWLGAHSRTDRVRDRQILQALAVAVGDALAAASGVPDVWRPDVTEAAGSASLLRGRLVAAYLNDDLPTLDALTAAWAAWQPSERAEVLRELISRLPRG